MTNKDENILSGRIRQGDSVAFSVIFSRYYADLVMFANTFIKDKDTSEEIVQDIFIKLWENRNEIEIKTSLKSFLLKSVQNKCIDRIRHLKIRDKYQAQVLDHPVLFENDTENYLLFSELEKNLESALRNLPEEVNKTFTMSRFEGFTYNEISEKMNISVRTVEVRVSKALVLLREQLKDFRFIIVLFIGLLN